MIPCTHLTTSVTNDMMAIDQHETQRTRAKYNRTAPLYDFLELPMELVWYRQWRRLLFARMRKGHFLEIGIGTGKNLRYHPEGVPGVGIDLSEGMLARAAARSGERNLALLTADVQSLPFSDNEFDTVIATFVFCSVPNPVLGLQEIHRVLKPGGELLMLEHVLPENPVLAWLFNALNSLVVGATGVHINRNTAENIRTAEFTLIEESNLLSTVFKLFVAKPMWREGHATSTIPVTQHWKELQDGKRY